jgi:Scramblase
MIDPNMPPGYGQTTSPGHGDPNMYGQPGQPPIYGQPPAYGQPGQPGQPPMYGQPGQPPMYGQPGQQPVYWQPEQSPMYGHPGQPQMYGQAGVMTPGMAMVPAHQEAIKKTGYQKLMENKGVYVKQKLDMLEVMTGCERNNRYDIYGLKESGKKKGKKLFKAKEKTPFCQRQFCAPAWREFKMKITSKASHEDDSKDFLKMYSFSFFLNIILATEISRALVDLSTGLLCRFTMSKTRSPMRSALQKTRALALE